MSMFIHRQKIFMAAIVLVVFEGCYTPAKEREVKKEIFDLQTRTIELERAVKEKDRVIKDTGTSTNKQIASASSEVEKLRQDMRKLQGDVDALRIGVTTGQMPGADEGTGPSIAKRLKAMEDRLEEMDSTNMEILAALDKASTGTKAKGGKEAKDAKGKDSKEKDRPNIASFEDLEKAFEKKRFKYIVEDGPKLIKGLKGDEKEKGAFLFAESLYKIGRLRESALEYNQFIENHPDSSKLAHARLRMGDSFRHLGDMSTAKIYYQEILEKHPKALEAETAKERLDRYFSGETAEAAEKKAG